MSLKKNIIILLVFVGSILLISAFYIVCQNIFYKNTIPEEFCIDDYKQFIEEFQSDIVLGSINSAKEAKRQAAIVWSSLYGNSAKYIYQPYVVYFDSSNKIWLVQGSVLFFENGGVPYILFEQETGKVLAVWHEK